MSYGRTRMLGYADRVPRGVRPPLAGHAEGGVLLVDQREWNARLVTAEAVAEIARFRAEDGGPMDIGGATLATAAMRAGLIDEYALVTDPVLLGAGTLFFAALDNWVNLSLVETGRFLTACS